MRTSFRITALAALVLGASACDDDPIFVGDRPGAPEDLLAEYAWVFEGFTSSGQSVGHPAVDLTWYPPSDWDEEPFRVYGKRGGSSGFFLIATVTSCTEDGCTYRDRNVAPGTTYEYYVATVNEDTDEETTSDTREVIFVPATSIPAAPRLETPVALDSAVYLRWTDPSNGANVGRYRVFLTRVDARTDYLYPVGESDGNGYVDLSAANGHTYGYRLAAVDTLGRVSSLSAEVTAVPRPDRTAELVYAHSANAAQSGFRFNVATGTAGVVSGTTADAHWRMERDGTGWRIVPLNGTRIADAGRTTALACGPGSGPECVAVTTAPASGYSTSAVALNPESSYVLAFTAGGRTHYGVVRVQLLGSDQQNRSLMIFDWSFQMISGEPRLDRRPS
ncbi:MAG TPA: hypothetical protein VK420_01775 [Longimicrobium sp.]|nr:hypothetical protein [Longimicrobium sp.]